MSKRNINIDLVSNAVGRKRSNGGTLPGSLHQSRPDPWSSRGAQRAGIKFGAPSNNLSEDSKVGKPWGRLISQAAPGGISGAFGGGGLLSAIGGLGSVLSGVMKLFGPSKRTPPPLSLFQLPDTQDQTVYVGQHSAQQPIQKGIYTAASTPPTLQYQSSEIAQAVKQALLTSSSLNDVIAEL